MRRPIIAGNWKCHKTPREAAALAKEIRQAVQAIEGVEIVVCPPFVAIPAVAGALSQSSIGLGAQDVFWEAQGAFTGEVAASMLVDAGCGYCIVGHSERRQYFHETDETVNRKLLALLTPSITPIVCIGETLGEREAGKTFEVVGRQLEGALRGVTAAQAKRIVLAYEPVWAIGTGRNATPAQAQEAHAFIRERLGGLWGRDVAQAIRIQYGGSVNADNAPELLQQADIDGALVGGASLKAESFAAIVKAAASAKLAQRA